VPIGTDRHLARAAGCSACLRFIKWGWLESQRLNAAGEFGVCKGTNCGGYNSGSASGRCPERARPSPDFEGWEIKGHSVTDFCQNPDPEI